jgi:hypothetical protein
VEGVAQVSRRVALLALWVVLGCAQAPPPAPKPSGTVQTLNCESEVVTQERALSTTRTDTVVKCTPGEIVVPPAGTQVPPTWPDPNATPDTP